MVKFVYQFNSVLLTGLEIEDLGTEIFGATSLDLFAVDAII